LYQGDNVEGVTRYIHHGDQRAVVSRSWLLLALFSARLSPFIFFGRIGVLIFRFKRIQPAGK
jgi:hypothetical protein